MPNVWVTYTWKDNDEGAFDYLVAELERGGVQARYDKIQLVPGRRLWEQIADRILSPDLDGWAYLLTPKSIASEACREELAYGLDRALQRGSKFPLIGLLHQIPIAEVPVALRTRLCVDLRAPNWVEQVKAGLEGRPPAPPEAASSPFVLNMHQRYGGVTGQNALEIRMRLGERSYWRIAYRDGSNPTVKGSGPAGGAGTSGIGYNVVQGTVTINGIAHNFYGEGGPLTPSTSAYIAFMGDLPLPLYLGFARDALGVPDQWFGIGQQP